MTNSSSQVVYGKLAYEGFAKAIGSRLGLVVKVEDGVNACIDVNGVVKLPKMQARQTAEEFTVTCGVIVHELAHQFYKSHLQIDPKRSRLEHDCLNAVLDVADETWVAEWFGRQGNARPGELLINCNRWAFHEGRSQLQDWNHASTHLWKVLCMGILSARLPKLPRRWLRYTHAAAQQHGVNAKECFRLLRQAKLSKRQDPAPTPKRFARLLKLAARLADLLKPLAPPDSAPQPGSMGGGVGSRLADAVGKGTATTGPKSREATEAEGQAFADKMIPGLGGGSSSGKSTGYEFCQDAYAMLSPSVQRIADRIAVDGDGAERIEGLLSGSCVAQAHRLLTDGQCQSRWDVSDHADGLSVSVLLDCSGSMNSILQDCAGIARAFSTAMRAAGEVQSLVFGQDVQESNDFERVSLMGGTNTHLAIRKSVRFLQGRTGRRWIILITDGQPNSPDLTEESCRQAVTAGIRILSIGLGDVVQLPYGTCVKASDPAHLAIELDAASQEIERQESGVC